MLTNIRLLHSLLLMQLLLPIRIHRELRQGPVQRLHHHLEMSLNVITILKLRQLFPRLLIQRQGSPRA